MRLAICITIILTVWCGLLGCEKLPGTSGKKEQKAVPKPPPIPTIKSDQALTDQLTQQQETEKDYVYDPTGKRNPFQPFIVTQTPVTPIEQNIPLTPLQKYDLSQLKLVAIIVGEVGNKALLEDAEGKGYIVEKGTYVGRNFGKVKSITKDSLIIEERFKDYMGEVKTRDIVLKLYPTGEGEKR